MSEQPELEDPLAPAARVVLPVRVSPDALGLMEYVAERRGMTRSGLARIYFKEGLERDLRHLRTHTQSPE